MTDFVSDPPASVAPTLPSLAGNLHGFSQDLLRVRTMIDEGEDVTDMLGFLSWQLMGLSRTIREQGVSINGRDVR